jgi:tetratricopeptide (TPR) repeat protein
MTRHASADPLVDLAAALSLARPAGECTSPLPLPLLERLARHVSARGDESPGEAALREARRHLDGCVVCGTALAELSCIEDRDPESPPLVGRDEELQSLQTAFDDARAGTMSTVTVFGAPGIGKSRLLREFASRVQAQGACVIEASGRPDDSLLAYGLLLQVLRELFDVPPVIDRDALARRLEATLRENDLDPGSLPSLLHLFAIRQDLGPITNVEPETLKLRLGRLLAQLLQRRSAMVPVVLAVDDLQWGDASSLECLRMAYQAIGHGPLLVVLACRSGVEGRWPGHAPSRRIDLQPLGENAAAALLRAWTPPGRLSPELVALGAGNPLFLEELARDARETSGPPTPWAASPRSLPEVVLRRVARLSPEARDLLEVASVVGLSVPVPLLAQVTGRSEPVCRRGLAMLRRSDFMAEPEGSGEDEFVFRHALIRDTVYGSRPVASRRLTHAAIASALEAQHPGRALIVAERVTHHLGYTTEDEKYVDYALLAAGKLQRRAAHQEVLELLDSALERLARMPGTAANRRRRVDAVLAQREARFALGQHREHIENLRAIAGEVEETGDARFRADWHYSLGFLGGLAGGSLREAIEHCRQAARIADAAGLADVYAKAECCSTQLLTMAGDLSDAVLAAKRALAIFSTGTREDSVFWACRTLWQLGAAQLAQGHWPDALESCNAALAYGGAIEDRRLMAVAWFRLGSAHMYRGDWPQGIEACDRALALSPFPFDEAIIRIVRGYGRARAGDHAGGVQSMQQGLAWFQNAKLRYSSLLGHVWLAEVHLRAGAGGETASLAGAVAEEARGLGYRHLEAVALRLRGEATLDAVPGPAADDLDRAAVTLEEIGAENELAKAWVARAELHWRAGNGDEGRRLLARALAAFERLGTVDELRRGRALLQAWEDRPPRP